MIREYKQPESLGPSEVNVSNVMHWCRHSKELNGSQRSKALKLVKYDCIKYIGDKLDNLPEQNILNKSFPDAKHVFLCLPLNSDEYFDFFGLNLKKTPFESDYNSSEYIIYKVGDIFSCNCQGYITKEGRGEIPSGGVGCSHVLALFYCFKMKKFGMGQGASQTLLDPDMEAYQ